MWVFGYGSLMWNPGFAFAAASKARLNGFRRALCIHSTHYRGTLQRPGLVFGLDRGGACDGVAFEIAPGEVDAVLANLRARELIYGVYREVRVSVALSAAGSSGGPDRVEAITYVAERGHPSYAGPLAMQLQARIVRGAKGCAGTNLAYLMNTLAHLKALGVRDRDIERVGQTAARISIANGDGSDASSGREPARLTALSGAWRRKPGGAAALTLCGQNRFQHRGKLKR